MDGFDAAETLQSGYSRLKTSGQAKQGATAALAEHFLELQSCKRFLPLGEFDMAQQQEINGSNGPEAGIECEEELNLLFAESSNEALRQTPPQFCCQSVAFAESAAASVWVNTRTRIYHRVGRRWYGLTKSGGLLPLKEARARGYRAAGNGQ